jgi:hypothetical protein
MSSSPRSWSEIWANRWLRGYSLSWLESDIPCYAHGYRQSEIGTQPVHNKKKPTWWFQRILKQEILIVKSGSLVNLEIFSNFEIRRFIFLAGRILGSERPFWRNDHSTATSCYKKYIPKEVMLDLRHHGCTNPTRTTGWLFLSTMKLCISKRDSYLYYTCS